jgi:hypothetical protein
VTFVVFILIVTLEPSFTGLTDVIQYVLVTYVLESDVPSLSVVVSELTKTEGWEN